MFASHTGIKVFAFHARAGAEGYSTVTSTAYGNTAEIALDASGLT
jgi:hypothetical protein